MAAAKIGKNRDRSGMGRDPNPHVTGYQFADAACAGLGRFVSLSRQLLERLLKDFGGLAAANQMPIIDDH
jgi:hypothetical protein